jgi:hypothetical protein
MKALILGALLVIAAGACLPPAGVIFKATVVQQPDDSYPMAVTLGDQTGLVTAIESADGDTTGSFAELDVRPDPDDAKAVILTFFTGACDDETVVSLQRSDVVFHLRVEVRAGFSLGCTAQLLIRGLRIQFSEPVAAGSIVALGGR